MESKNLNRLRVVLAEKNLSNKWLSEHIGIGPATVSKWVTNTSQPSLEQLLKIAEVLDISYTELIRVTPKESKKDE